MAIDLNVVNNGEGIEIILSDIVYGHEIIARQNSDHANTVFPPNLKYILIDYSRVKESYVSADEVKIIAENDRKTFEKAPHLIMAAIVPNDLFRNVSDVWVNWIDANTNNVKNFSSRDEAEAWIKSCLLPN